jgi:hypothetical protein
LRAEISVENEELQRLLAEQNERERIDLRGRAALAISRKAAVDPKPGAATPRLRVKSARVAGEQ